MGYFSLLIAHAQGPGWLPALGWNIIPAGLGNIIGAVLLVAVPSWLVSSSATPRACATRRAEP